MDKINRPDKPKKDDLKRLYDICNKIFNKKECFYTKEESKIMKKEKEKL